MERYITKKIINVPVFYLGLDVLIWMWGNPFLGPFLDFKGPPLQTALVMDFPASKSVRPAPYKKQVH